jgi:hypothetical protein
MTLGVATFLLAVLVIVYAMLRGQDVKRVTPGGEIEFYSSGGGTEFSSEEIKQRQNNMDQRLSELEQRARQSASQSPTPPMLPSNPRPSTAAPASPTSNWSTNWSTTAPSVAPSTTTPTAPQSPPTSPADLPSGVSGAGVWLGGGRL